MRYSFISEGESHYICMHAETAMYLRLKGEGFAEQCLQNRILFRETTVLSGKSLGTKIDLFYINK